jgi:hypothetical protein
MTISVREFSPALADVLSVSDCHDQDENYVVVDSARWIRVANNAGTRVLLAAAS